jgi:hypothetical protein
MFIFYLLVLSTALSCGTINCDLNKVVGSDSEYVIKVESAALDNNFENKGTDIAVTGEAKANAIEKITVELKSRQVDFTAIDTDWVGYEDVSARENEGVNIDVFEAALADVGDEEAPDDFGVEENEEDLEGVDIDVFEAALADVGDEVGPDDFGDEENEEDLEGVNIGVFEAALADVGDEVGPDDFGAEENEEDLEGVDIGVFEAALADVGDEVGPDDFGVAEVEDIAEDDETRINEEVYSEVKENGDKKDLMQDNFDEIEELPEVTSYIPTETYKYYAPTLDTDDDEVLSIFEGGASHKKYALVLFSSLALFI